jgi:hypothetical protein
MEAGRNRAAEARRIEKAQRQDFAGIPESVRFGGSPEAEKNPVLDCHVGGMLVRNMPLENQSRILYQQTDEGIAEANAGKSDRRVEVLAGPFEKSIQHKKDDILERGMETWEAADPMREVTDQHSRPGFRNRFLSDKAVKDRGMRGWQPVRGENGDPVKLGGMTLAEMPESKARARAAHFKDANDRRMQQIEADYLEGGGKTAVSDHQ